MWHHNGYGGTGAERRRRHVHQPLARTARRPENQCLEPRAIVSGSGVIPPEVTYALRDRRALMWVCRSPECDCERLQRGSLGRDESAANELARTLTPMVDAVVRKKLPYAQPDDLAEVRQDTFLLVFRNLGQWRGECRFCFWVRQIAIRAAFDQSRRDLRQKRLRKSEDDPDRVIVPQTPPLSPQVWKRVDRTLERLPDDQRRIPSRCASGRTRPSRRLPPRSADRTGPSSPGWRGSAKGCSTASTEGVGWPPARTERLRRFWKNYRPALQVQPRPPSLDWDTRIPSVSGGRMGQILPSITIQMTIKSNESLGENYDEPWRARVAAELEAYRAEQQRLYGGIDELTLARYEAGVSPLSRRAMHGSRAGPARSPGSLLRKCLELLAGTLGGDGRRPPISAAKAGRALPDATGGKRSASTLPVAVGPK